MQSLSSSVTARAVPSNCLPVRTDFEQQLVEILPGLRAFALRLTRNAAESDDLVQETAFRALRACGTFQAGTNMQAWARTILRNCRIQEFRRQGSRHDELTDEIVLRHPVRANQEDSVELSETLGAMDRLKSVHRDVLTLVRVMGHDYSQAASLLACPVGTIKSRLNRADAALRLVLQPLPN